ncbi:MAG: putative Fe-S cluster assembly protein SufT [Gammaproteobacteria bacterium]|nr:putative Fe-S cluster assembly protein SufT [Gammaproteobacteria bacterium]
MLNISGDPVPLNRDTRAVMIPAGNPVIIPEGTEVVVAQELGGAFTIYLGGQLARIAGKDADALGKEPTQMPELPEDATDADVEQLVWDQMRTCFDPEIPINIVDLGLVYRCELKKQEDGDFIAEVDMTLTAPGCGMGDIIAFDVKEKVEMVPRIKQANVDLTFDPPWNQSMMSDEARLKTGMY